MNFRIVVVLLAMVVTNTHPAELHAQEKEPTSSADQEGFDQLQRKLAATRLTLAEMDLQEAVDQNRRSPGIVPLVVIESLQMSLAKAKAQLAAAEGDKEAQKAAWLASADANLEVARKRLSRMKEYVQRTGEAGSDIKRAELRMQIAELERDSLAGLFDLPLEQQLKWQIEQMQATIEGLSDRVIVLEDKR